MSLIRGLVRRNEAAGRSDSAGAAFLPVPLRVLFARVCWMS